jgi:hypothetical protein
MALLQAFALKPKLQVPVEIVSRCFFPIRTFYPAVALEKVCQHFGNRGVAYTDPST